MAFTGIQALVDFYTVREAQITNQVTDIMMRINEATRDMSDLSEETSYKRGEVQAEYSPDEAEYQAAMDEIKDEYQLQLAEITAWESELETEKSSLQTELQATTSFKQSYQSMLKQNVSKDFSYGGSSK